ncbi:MFS transporter [Uliginosibacterium sp. H3]|uniref:MFS transporter n=1 Tax=Uliginosibacterium silvisoli TaxID=3114758 RepID=A0ABU6JYI3_9RHOO|nr:MFS transporter [Uliginosibacterium sp. H3]
MNFTASLRSSRIATMALFFCSGFVFASWGVHIPTIKDKFALGEGALSIAMLSVALGAVLAMRRIGSLSAQLGSARTSLYSGLLLAVSAGLILVMPDYTLLVIWLLLFGAANAALDVAMNSQAAIVENLYARPIMSSMHGLFSLGGFAGALLGAIWFGLGAGVTSHMLLVAVITAISCVLARPALRTDPPHESHESASDKRQVGRHLRRLGMLAFLGLVAEGAMYDWSAVYMRDHAHASAAWVNAGYAAFSAGMAGGRFAGDAIRGALGSVRILQWSAGLCVAGIALALLLPLPLPAAIGCGLIGLGASNMMPVLFAASANAKGIPPSEAIAAMARIAYMGLLCGPVLIGLLAQATGLPFALCIVGVSAAMVGMRARGALRDLEEA